MTTPGLARSTAHAAVVAVLALACLARGQVFQQQGFQRGAQRLGSPRQQQSFGSFAEPQFQRQQQQQQFQQPLQQQQFQQFQQASGFSCPERNGYFANSRQCDAYYKCENGVAKEELCPDGLLFNDKNSPFSYPCSYPNEVQCLTRSAVQPAQPTEDCPHQYGYYALGDAANCGKFMNCAAGRGYVFDCPDGLAFNPETYHCDWPDQVASCDAEAFLQFRCPEEPLLFGQRPAETRLLRSNTDCEHYFACVNGRPRRYNCGEGNAFSEELGHCDVAENVTGCAPAFRSGNDFRQTRLF
ncbi:protein obstructor-E isoform X2 [Thrips palmi]|uniref:Protein obstructor-E isoform X2 n=1 Tax=Thrips palmi TaxID=161013 RepID=A0A6P8YL25_THRPL|nr:protein obstructor-E isoform X2 [Thrips palmi]